MSKQRRCCLCATDVVGVRDYADTGVWRGVVHRDCMEAWLVARRGEAPPTAGAASTNPRTAAMLRRMARGFV